MKELIKNIVVWFVLGILLGMAIGTEAMYRLNSWLMDRTVKTGVMLYYDDQHKPGKDRIFDLRERL